MWGQFLVLRCIYENYKKFSKYMLGLQLLPIGIYN